MCYIRTSSAEGKGNEQEVSKEEIPTVKSGIKCLHRNVCDGHGATFSLPEPSPRSTTLTACTCLRRWLTYHQRRDHCTILEQDREGPKGGCCHSSTRCCTLYRRMHTPWQHRSRRKWRLSGRRRSSNTLRACGQTQSRHNIRCISTSWLLE